MSDTVIRASNLGKRYRIGERAQGMFRYKSLRDSISAVFLRPGSSSLRRPDDFLWALKDVSFEVQRGEVVGIIGRNGAGKSTLLKILSRITEPTEGQAEIRGRVGSLLEVGTGFHPELTGRDNIFLNGAILGMRRAEIARKFDEIVAFAEVEPFVDTPVKHYSSGMYVRLAFAVAAHMETEILLVDEVLAVGDAAFQKKSLGKMGAVAREGCTVLFVSHQLGNVMKLCRQAMLLDKGGIIMKGNAEEVLSRYIQQVSSNAGDGWISRDGARKEMFIRKVQGLGADNESRAYFTHQEPIRIAVECLINQWVADTVFGFYVTDQRGRKVFTNNNPEWEKITPRAKTIRTEVSIPARFLVPGQYAVSFAISIHHLRVIDLAENALSFTVVDAGTIFSSYEGYDYGCVFADCKWELHQS